MLKNGGNNKAALAESNNTTVDYSSTKNKQKTQAKKRKRHSSGSSGEYKDVLPENTLEIEKNLHASAVKNNLDDVSVRKILKKVVTNDHVLALVKLREEEEDSGAEDDSHCPKLTRAKARELKKVSQKTTPWNLENLELTPIKHIPVKTRPEVKALIAQELPEDEDDEEYEPAQDEVASDDEQTVESCSDLESQPRTPATPQDLAVSPKVVKDGPFKVPQDITTPVRRKLNLEEDATIARRTRSKLSLSSTPIEHIESTFVPPDDLPLPDVDDLWNQFLNECLNPASSSRHEDDDEADPEYNVAADPDANDEDEESLGNSLIKISKKELNDLVTELFNIMPETTAAEALAGHNHASTRWEGKQEPHSDEEGSQKMPDRITFETQSYTKSSLGKSEIVDPLELQAEKTVQEQSKGGEDQGQKDECNNMKAKRKATVAVDAPSGPVTLNIVIEERDEGATEVPEWMRRYMKPTVNSEQVMHVQVDGATILPEQVLILQQQLRQHIQLATSNYLQLYVHPVHWKLAPTYKEYLDSFSKLSEENTESVVSVCNLKPAWELVLSWERTVAANTPENTDMVQFILKEAERCRRRASGNNLYVGEFHDMFKQVVAASPVFLYPYLLPSMPYRTDAIRRSAYTRSEDELIALGLDQFWQYVEENPTLYKPKSTSVSAKHRWGLVASADLMMKHMFPWMSTKSILSHVSSVKRLKDKDNPINKFLNNRQITPVEHKLLPFNPRMTLYEQPEHEMPRLWVRYLAKNSQRFRQYLNSRKNVTGFAPIGVPITVGTASQEVTKKPLPIDFTRHITSTRQNAKSPTNTLPDPTDRFNVEINKITVEPDKPGLIVIQSVLADNISKESPVPDTNKAPAFVYRMVETSTGGLLVPVTAVATVDSNKGPITTPAEVPSKTVNIQPKTPAMVMQENHCKCCLALRKICKRQTKILEYFRKGSGSLERSCYCGEVKYPRVSNKLRLFLHSYQNKLQSNLRLLESNIENASRLCDVENYYSERDLEYATCYQQRLLTRVGISRMTHVKRRVHGIFAKFHMDTGDPVTLARTVDQTFREDLLDMYQEFLVLLTPAQAEELGQFREYFRRACVDDLVGRVKDLVPDSVARGSILKRLHRVFYDNVSDSCQICCDLLVAMAPYPPLAEYTFSLFPHRTKKGPTPHESVPRPRRKNYGRSSTPKTKAVPVNKESTETHTIQATCPKTVCTKEIAKVTIDLKERCRSVLKTGINQETITPDETRMVLITASKESACEVSRTVSRQDESVLRPHRQSHESSSTQKTTGVAVNMESMGTHTVQETGSKTVPTAESREIESVPMDLEEGCGSIVRAAPNIETIMRPPHETRNVIIVASEDSVRETSATDIRRYDTELCIDEEAGAAIEPCSVDSNPHPNDTPTSQHKSPANDSRMEMDETIVKTEIQFQSTFVPFLVQKPHFSIEDTCELSNSSMCIVFEDETVKPEMCEWNREEDKLILEVLKDQLTPEERKDKTIAEILEEKSVFEILADSLTHKSLDDVRNRVLYLVQLLVLTEHS